MFTLVLRDVLPSHKVGFYSKFLAQSVFFKTAVKTVTDLEEWYPEEYAPKPYVHLARAHGAGTAYTTIYGKANSYSKDLTNFAAVPEILRRYVQTGDYVSTSLFVDNGLESVDLILFLRRCFWPCCIPRL